MEQTGLFSVIGGGLKRLSTSALPFPFGLSVVMQLVKDEADPFESPIEIRVLRPDESIALSVTGKMTFKDGDTLNVAINVSVLLDVEGRWSVEALLDSAGLAVTHELRVQLQSPA